MYIYWADTVCWGSVGYLELSVELPPFSSHCLSLFRYLVTIHRVLKTVLGLEQEIFCP